MKEAHDRGSEVIHMYEMRSKKNKLSVDHNKSTMDEEQGIKDRGKKHILIKPKVEADEGINDSHQVQTLKQRFQTLQQQNLNP